MNIPAAPIHLNARTRFSVFGDTIYDYKTNQSHPQTGDLVVDGLFIDLAKLTALIKANTFVEEAYSHHGPMPTEQLDHVNNKLAMVNANYTKLLEDYAVLNAKLVAMNTPAEPIVPATGGGSIEATAPAS